MTDVVMLTPFRRFGAELRKYRKERGMSQRALEERCGCSKTTISRLERGLVREVAAPFEVLRKAALVLELPGKVEERLCLHLCRGYLQALPMEVRQRVRLSSVERTREHHWERYWGSPDP